MYSTPTFRLLGAQFGSYDHSVTVRAADTRCESSEWISSTYVACRLSRGIAAFEIFRTTGGQRTGSASKAFTYFRKIYEMITDGGQVVPQQSLTCVSCLSCHVSNIRLYHRWCRSSR